MSLTLARVTRDPRFGAFQLRQPQHTIAMRSSRFTRRTNRGRSADACLWRAATFFPETCTPAPAMTGCRRSFVFAVRLCLQPHLGDRSSAPDDSAIAAGTAPASI
jgi:hypothetical protein